MVIDETQNEEEVDIDLTDQAPPRGTLADALGSKVVGAEPEMVDPCSRAQTDYHAGPNDPQALHHIRGCTKCKAALNIHPQ